MIKVKSFEGSQIDTNFAGKSNLYRIAKDVSAKVYLEGEGVLKYNILKGFPTNMRSGSAIINSIIPKFSENNLYNLAILIHDFNYTKLANGDNPVSRLMADEMLRQMVIMSGELGSFRASLMYNALRIGGGSAYESENDGDYSNASNFMEFRWEAKQCRGGNI